jgi:hypothetical protein
LFLTKSADDIRQEPFDFLSQRYTPLRRLTFTACHPPFTRATLRERRASRFASLARRAYYDFLNGRSNGSTFGASTITSLASF